MGWVRCAGDTLFEIESGQNAENQRLVGRNEKRLQKPSPKRSAGEGQDRDA